MKKFHATGVYAAISIGTASIFKHQNTSVRCEKIKDTEKELKRFAMAKEQAITQLSEIYEKALLDIGETHAQIFEIHMMMIKDDDYNESIENIIKTQSANAEYAIAVTSNNFAKMFEAMDDTYMQARAIDVRDISNRIIERLTNENQQKSEFSDKMIVCADDLTPSETISLDKNKVLAIVTAFGSLNSHTAILVRNMSIPAVINAGKDFLKSVCNGDKIIVDSHTGDIIIAPDIETEALYLKKQAEDRRIKALFKELKGKENITKDGKRIDIYANINGVRDISTVLANDAGGIGMFRSEFLYLENKDFPTEETQFYTYKKVLESMTGKRVIIRTLDIGADKQADYFGLDKEGTTYSKNIEIGIMIETPAAAIISDELAPLVDFFSVGTNDLTQYTLACDRQNSKLEPFIDPHHKAVLRLIEISAKNAHKSGARIGICGELAADTSLTERFLKMGIDELSVSAPFILPLRKEVRNADLSK